MSANELAGAIGDRVRSSTNRLVLQGPLQIVNKRLYRGVALLRILLQRLLYNRVQVARHADPAVPPRSRHACGQAAVDEPAGTRHDDMAARSRPVAAAAALG